MTSSCENHKYRADVAQLIGASSHTLREGGRYSRPNVKISYRTCNICGKVLEDEAPFLNHCSLYKAVEGRSILQYTKKLL